MHILLLNEYYPPDTSATANQAAWFTRRLSPRHRVTVLAGRPSYDPTEFYAWRLLRRETRGNITVERVGSSGISSFSHEPARLQLSQLHRIGPDPRALMFARMSCCA